MNKVSIVGRYKELPISGQNFTVFDTETGRARAEVQAFTFVSSIDDAISTVKLLCIDFSGFDPGCTNPKALEAAANGELLEFTEEAELVSFDLKKE